MIAFLAKLSRIQFPLSRKLPTIRTTPKSAKKNPINVEDGRCTNIVMFYRHWFPTDVNHLGSRIVSTDRCQALSTLWLSCCISCRFSFLQNVVVNMGYLYLGKCCWRSSGDSSQKLTSPSSKEFSACCAESEVAQLSYRERATVLRSFGPHSAHSEALHNFKTWKVLR
eukprot:92454-Amphidinium_carterae.1